MIETINVALVKVNEYVIKDAAKGPHIWVPSQFLRDNKAETGDSLSVYRNANNVAELIVRIEKAKQEA